MQESRAITRKSASNLALAFILLPKAKREGMSALYAFCREVDDVADDESVPVDERRAKLAAWREDVRRACQRAAGLQPAEVSAGNAANPSVARATAGTQVHQLQAGGALEPQFVVIRELEAVIRQYPALHSDCSTI